MLFARNKLQLDADGMTARFAITDYINQGEPFIVKSCEIIQPPGAEIVRLMGVSGTGLGNMKTLLITTKPGSG